MSRFGLSVALAIMAVGATCLVAEPAGPPETTLPAIMTKGNPEPRIIVSQLQAAIAEEKKALAIYQAAGPMDDISEGHLAATNAYVAIRAARSGLGAIRFKRKFADPVLDLAFDKVNRAWNRSRGPVDHIAPLGAGRAGYLATSVRQMNEVITWLEQVLLMWP